MKCPRCDSQHIQAITETKTKTSRSGISASKGILGGLLFGPLGAVSGTLMGNKKTESKTGLFYICLDCDKKFKKGWFN